jgi:uncharacterized protein YegJ (DUF2314 family)
MSALVPRRHLWPRTSVQTLLISIGFSFLLACSSNEKPRVEPVPAGVALGPRAEAVYVIYYLPRATSDPRRALDALPHPDFPLVAKIPETGSAAMMSIEQQDPSRGGYIPDDETLRYFGRGVTAEQSKALKETKEIAILHFVYRGGDWKAARASVELAWQLAEKTGGLLWDDETRELLTTAAWRERRLDSWTDTIPEISQHTVIHAYQNGEYIRAVTLGMKKFALPDLTVNNFGWSSQRAVGNTINVLAQALAEGKEIRAGGDIDIDLRTIANRATRESQLATLKANAKPVALLRLATAKPEEGDADNRLAEITFDRYPGVDLHARQDALLSALWGSEDKVEHVEHTAELLEASRAARLHLPELHVAFDKGLAPGEYIQVKAPFKTVSGGNEWMWVEVIRWKGDSIEGLLTNDPFEIPSMHAGQEVEVSERDVFDYMRHYADGRDEGNSTGAIIEKLAQ